MAEVSTGKRSYFAVLLSILLPGLGQVYLRKPLKGFVCFLGVISALGIMYVNSLPVYTWRDVVDFSDLLTFLKAQIPENTQDSDTTAPAAQDEMPHYHLYTLTGDLRFRIGLEYEHDLNNPNYVSIPLNRAFQAHKLMLTENARIVVTRQGEIWHVNDTHQIFIVKKQEGELNVYDGKKLMFRPSWKFKATGLIQGVLFWLYAIYDGWQGRRGINTRKLLKEKAKEATSDSHTGLSS